MKKTNKSSPHADQLLTDMERYTAKSFDMINDDYIAVTIAPSDPHQHYGDPLRFIKSYTFLQQTLSQFFKPYSTDYTFYLEISSPKDSSKSSPRWHLHGSVKFHDIIGFMDTSFYEISKQNILYARNILDERWNEYITKDSKLIQAYCKKHHQPYPLLINDELQLENKQNMEIRHNSILSYGEA